MSELWKKYKKYKLLIYGLPALLFVLVGIIISGAIIGALTILLQGQSQQGDCTTNSATNIGNVASSKDKTQNAKTIYNVLIKNGFTKESAAGLLGTWDFEANFDPKTVNSAGYTGIAQWGGSRLSDLKSYGAKNGGADTLKGQLAFFFHELDTNYQNMSNFRKTKDIDKAVEQWTKQYEGLSQNPDQWHFTTDNGGHIGRKDAAHQWYTKFAGSGGIANSGQVSDNEDNDTSANIPSDCSTDNTISAGGFTFPFADHMFPQGGQNFGMRTLNGNDQWHDGWDLGQTGAKIHAVHNGKVIFAGDPKEKGIDDSFPNGLGKQVIVTKASDGLEIVYQEFDNAPTKPKVKVGQVVHAGDVIATLKTDHLHIGFTKKDWVKAQSDAFTKNSPTWIDPTKFLGGKNVAVPKD